MKNLNRSKQLTYHIISDMAGGLDLGELGIR